MKVQELHPRMPVTVTKSDSLEDAARVLVEENIGALVVFEPEGMAGILSERDIVRAIADDCDLQETEVCEYMTPAPVVTEEQAALGDAIAKMNGGGMRHVVVVADGDVSGVISMRDVVGLLGTDWPEL